MFRSVSYHLNFQMPSRWGPTALWPSPLKNHWCFLVLNLVVRYKRHFLIVTWPVRLWDGVKAGHQRVGFWVGAVFGHIVIEVVILFLLNQSVRLKSGFSNLKPSEFVFYVIKLTSPLRDAHLSPGANSLLLVLIPFVSKICLIHSEHVLCLQAMHISNSTSRKWMTLHPHWQ